MTTAGICATGSGENAAEVLSPEDDVEDAPDDLPCVFLGAVEIPPGAASAILSLTYAQCRFPIGEPGSEFFAFCTETREEGKAYCAHHNRLVEPVTKKRTRPLGQVGLKTMNSHSSTTSFTYLQVEILPNW